MPNFFDTGPAYETRPFYIRILHCFFDFILAQVFITILIFPLFYVEFTYELIMMTNDKLLRLLGLGVYYLVFETLLLGRPVSHYITGSKVVKTNGKKPSKSDLLKRSLMRINPFDWVSFLGRKDQGWHDSFSNTYVISKSTFKTLQDRANVEQEITADTPLDE